MLKDECQGRALHAHIIVFIIIAIENIQFQLVYLHFGKLQSNTFPERIPKISTDYKTNSTTHVKISQAVTGLLPEQLLQQHCYHV